MSALSLANLGVGTSFTGGEPQGRPIGLDRAEAFQDALARRAGGASDASVAQASPATGVADPSAVSRPDVKPAEGPQAADRERVRRSLGLEGAPPAASTGDTILGGLQKLRGVFDARQAHLNDIMNSPVANTQALMSMQMEVAQYTVMVDVSSKLTGKAASSLDTLMKGQ